MPIVGQQVPESPASRWSARCRLAGAAFLRLSLRLVGLRHPAKNTTHEKAAHGWACGSIIVLLASSCSLVGMLGLRRAATAAPSYTAIDLGTLGLGGSRPYALNDSGQVVGYSQPDALPWTAGGGMVNLGTLTGSGQTQPAR